MGVGAAAAFEVEVEIRDAVHESAAIEEIQGMPGGPDVAVVRGPGAEQLGDVFGPEAEVLSEKFKDFSFCGGQPELGLFRLRSAPP